MNNKIGYLIEKYRKEKGLTQSELAKKLGVSNTAISKWEHGNNLPDITLLEPLSEILGIDKLILFTSENEIKEETNERVKQIKRKNRIKLTIMSIIFAFVVVFTNYISYKIYTHKLDTIESNQTKIYKFHSTDPEFLASGYLILNAEGSSIMFDQFKYQTIHTNDKRKLISKIPSNIEMVELYVYANEELIYNSFCKQKTNENMDFNGFLQRLINKNVQGKHKINEKYIEKFQIEIKIDTKNKHIEKSIQIEISNEI